MCEEEEIYYKIVRVSSNNELLSLIVQGVAAVKYKLLEWVYPPSWLKKKGQGLFVFSGLYMAKKYYDYYSMIFECKLFKCKIGEILNQPKFFDIEGLAFGDTFDDSGQDFPWSTVMTDKVMLLEEVSI